MKSRPEMPMQDSSAAVPDITERFAAGFEHAPIGVALVAPDGHWLRVNRAFCELVGYTEAELLTRTFQDITPPQDQAVVALHLGQMLSGETRSCRMEKHYVHAQGHIVEVLLNVALVRDEHGQPHYFISHMQDISERKRAEADLVEREADLRETQRLAGLGSWHLDLGTGDVRWSEQAFLIFGLDPAGGAPSYAGLATMLDSAGSATLEAALQEAIERGTPFVIEAEAVRPDRSRRWLVLRGEAVRDAAGNIGAVRGTAFDGTDRKRADEALRASEAEFRTLAEAMPQIVWVTRADGRVVYMNQKWMDYTGLTLEQSLGEGWTQPFHPDDRQRSWQAWQHATATVGTYALECRLRGSDGSYRWWLTRGEPQRDVGGQVIKWIGTCTDIHDMKLAEESLAAAARRAGMAEVAIDVLHNVGNALNSVNVSAGVVAAGVRASRTINLVKVAALLQEHASDLAAFLTSDSRGRRLPEYLSQLGEHLQFEQRATLRELGSLLGSIDHIKAIVAMQQNHTGAVS